MKMQKKEFLSPEIEILPLPTEDVIRTSGFDANDTWVSDIFF